ncbi:DNA methyltransferase, partial [Vibrio anguillarum]
GDVVLDPFMGSGTTAIAALQNNRTYIGLEREEKYVALAKQRIFEAQKQISLF